MKAKYVTRDRYGEAFDCGRHGNVKIRELHAHEKEAKPDCLTCLGNEPIGHENTWL